MKKDTKLRIIITFLSLIVISAHLIWPSLSIDGITLSFIIVALIPWLAPLFKSLEFPGGWKIEFQELQRTKEKADEAGLLAPQEFVNETPEYTFQTILYDDPNLALAGLRIEIEKRLKQIAESNDIHVKKESIGLLLRQLSLQEVLTGQESVVLQDLIGLLNSAVHGAKVDRHALEWAIDVGPRLLKSLDEKVKTD